MCSVIVFLEALMEAKLPRSNGYLLLSAFSSYFPEIFHGVGVSPTFTPVLPMDFFNGKLPFSRFEMDMSVNQGEELAIRINFLDDVQAAVFCKNICGEVLRLSKAEFLVKSVSSKHKFCSSCEGGLPKIGVAAKKINFIFLTPTAFRRQGRLYLLPDPVVLFSTLYQRYKRLCTQCEHIDDTFEYMYADSNIVISRCNIRSDMLKLKDNTIQKGFCGTTSFDLSYCDDTTAKCATALANFARYCGVGIKVSQGMGSVWTDFQ